MHRLRFNLRWLFLAMLVVAGALGFLQRRNNFIRSEVAALRELGVRIDWQDRWFWVNYPRSGLIVFHREDGSVFIEESQTPVDLAAIELRMKNIGVAEMDKLEAVDESLFDLIRGAISGMWKAI